MELIKISPDKERAKSLLKMVELIEERIKTQDKIKMSALIIIDYYEIIKELITAILFIEGYKTLSHKDLLDYIGKYHSEFNNQEMNILDELRILRNRASYEGLIIQSEYLERNESFFNKIIIKLKEIILKKL
jgi:hypothetical protein